MSIVASCEDCGRSVRVAERSAGARIRCPGCGKVFAVAKPPEARRKSRWSVRSHDGNRYGPVSKEELDGWVEEGLVTAACLLQREGAAGWQAASEVYTQLAQAEQESEGEEKLAME